MVCVKPNPAQGFHFFDPMSVVGLPGLNSPPSTTTTTVTASGGGKGDSCNTLPFLEDPSKKIRKPYTITKSRESWTEQEHDKFLEALQLFDRDWKKIEAFIGSKTVIQIRSHAQKYFLKVQKNGTSEHVPPPRPKRKAAHPYPQKAPKNAAVIAQVAGPFQSSCTSLESGYVYQPDSSSILGNTITGAALSSWSYNSVPPAATSQIYDAVLSGPTIVTNNCYISSNESTPRAWHTGEIMDPRDQGKPIRVMPDFSQVYSFIGSVFDPSSSGHLQRMKQMDPINFETVLLLMRNLTINLTSTEFENHRMLLATYDVNTAKPKSGVPYENLAAGKSVSAIAAT